jgi:transcriptional regulator with XRE-family HTH domain
MRQYDHRVILVRRRALGLTLDAIAQELCVSKVSVSLWELGRTRPTVDKLGPLADVLQLDSMDLLFPVTTPTALSA